MKITIYMYLQKLLIELEALANVQLVSVEELYQEQLQEDLRVLE